MEQTIIKDRLNRFELVCYPQEIHNCDIVGETKFIETAVKEFGYRIARGTAAGFHKDINYEEQFRNCLKGRNLGRVVEIGTWRGVSTAILAHYAESVITIDIRYYEEARRFWIWAGVYDKIRQVVVDNNKGKELYLERADFDFAYIDGDHHYDQVALDFDCVKKCDRVLFHDYWDHTPEVKAFIDTLDNVVTDEPFAYWQCID